MTRDEFVDKWAQYVRASAPTGPKEIARIREFIDDVDALLTIHKIVEWAEHRRAAVP